MGIWERLQDDTSAVNLKFLSLLAASLFRNFKFKNRTRIIKLLVVLRFRSSHLNVTRALANFGIGPLVDRTIAERLQQRLPCPRNGRMSRPPRKCRVAAFQSKWRVRARTDRPDRGDRSGRIVRGLRANSTWRPAARRGAQARTLWRDSLE